MAIRRRIDAGEHDGSLAMPTYRHASDVQRTAAADPAAQTEGVGRQMSPDTLLGLQGSVGNQAVTRMVQAASVQPSTEDAVMAGLAHDGGGASRRDKRKRPEKGSGSDEEKPPPRRATRASGKTFDLAHPILKFSSSYQGPRTQKLDATQAMGFDQDATLQRPNGAPQRVSFYYEFRQQVRDGYEAEDGSGHALGTNFVQDGPYRPPYTNEVITDAQDTINFHDNPGFSTGSRIQADQWLKWYKVFFRWKVKRKDTNSEWTSPEVSHSLDSPYNDGDDNSITTTSSPDATWAVDCS
jgi:hypothetical protein